MNFDTAAMAQGVFNAIVAQLAADPTFILPDRRYISAGDPVFDCAELVVHGVRICQGLPGLQLPTRTIDTSTWTFELAVTVVRCVPVAAITGPPAAADLNTAGLAVIGDGGALLRAAVTARFAAKTLLPMCSDVDIGPVAYGVPDGGMVGVSLSISTQL
jgi:hypothetical protein